MTAGNDDWADFAAHGFHDPSPASEPTGKPSRSADNEDGQDNAMRLLQRAWRRLNGGRFSEWAGDEKHGNLIGLVLIVLIVITFLWTFIGNLLGL